MQTVLDPMIVDALAASLQATAFVATILGCVFAVAAVYLIVHIVMHSSSFDDEAAGVLLVAFMLALIATGLIVTYYDELVAPKYEAVKQLHNKQVEGYKLPQ